MTRLVLPALLAQLLVGCASLSYDPEKVLYLSDKRSFGGDGVTRAFGEVLPQDQPIVLFIHGRGNEPGMSLEGTDVIWERLGVGGRAVHKLEQGYGVSVVLFSWDSKRAHPEAQ